LYVCSLGEEADDIGIEVDVIVEESVKAPEEEEPVEAPEEYVWALPIGVKARIRMKAPAVEACKRGRVMNRVSFLGVKR
jgi:hypothetical protein